MNCLSSPPIQVSSLGFLSKLDHGQVISPSFKSRKLVVNSQGKNRRQSINNYRQAVAVEAPVVVEENGPKDDGIGIVKFLKGKNFFITGATGFLGKVLVEKLLRSTPDIGKIYLMIQAKDKEIAAERLMKEIIEAEIFKNIKQKMGGSYESFMLSKLIPVRGNMGDSDLNLDKNDSQMVARDVHFIIGSAASTTFDERYDISMKINTKGPCNLLEFGKKCDKLELFLQISTAYANGERKGRVMEKLFVMGDTIARENSSIWGSKSPILDVENELRLALNSNIEVSEGDSLPRYMKKLGQQRAHVYGWQDTYVFTKAMGEMMVNHLRGDIPVVILRPSIIESTYRDPFPGWIEGNRMLDPLISMYGKGATSGFLGPPHCLLDVVPADMVVNALVAALAKHGMSQKAEINVYQVTSSIENPMYMYNMGKSSFNHFNSNPHIDTNGVPVIVSPWKFFDSKEDFISSVRGRLSSESTSGFTRLQERIANQIEHLTQVYEPYTCGQIGRFDMNNTMGLLESMSDEEKETFGFDVKEIDWKNYLENIHIPGLRKHVMKARGTNM